MSKVYLLFVLFQYILNYIDTAVKKNPIISSSGLVCEDNPSVAESGYSCSFLAKRFGGFLGCEKLLKDLSQDSLPPGIPGNTRVVDACPYSCNKCKECSFGCALWFIGNGVCDPECNNVNCQFDGGDCWKVDCKLSSWSTWTSCSVTCGPGGRVTRTRQVLVNPRNGGDSCGALIAEETGCNSHIPCPLSCNVSDWGAWSKCSSSCGIGHQMRERSILKAPKDQNLYQCPETRQIRECFQDSCTSDCVLGEFKFISVISANPCTEENGCIERREIISPPYKPLENYTCEVEERLINCNEVNKNCLEACEFSEWSNWSSCSYFKDNNIDQTKYKLMRKRRKESKKKIKNAICQDKIEYKECDNNDKLGVEALIRCNMGDWSSWSSCSTSCGLGSRLRARWLLSGPQNDETLSESLLNTESVCGPLFQTKACNDRSCITKTCRVSEWSQWSECSSKTCNVPGLSKRYRSVTSLPKKGDCPILEESKDCIGACEQSMTMSKSNCIFGDWSAWSSCEDECYTKRNINNLDNSTNKRPKKYRHKMIVFNPNNKDCSKEKEYLEIRECEQKCENSLTEICQVTEWGPWSNCSANCDGGSRRRIRERVNSPKNSGKTSVRPLTRGINNNCPSLLEVEKCNTYPCINNCELGPWYNKDMKGESEENIILGCSTKCGVGFVRRIRNVISEGFFSSRFDEEYINRVCGPLEDKLKCLRVSEGCNISCQVGEWGPWSSCSVSCGEGFQSRERELLIPSIGKKCELSTEEIRECYESSCPSSCLVSTWSEWSSCLGGCDEKPYRRRERMILEAPTYSLKCPHLMEINEESEDVCPKSERCPTDCQVSSWSQWSECDVNCGIGLEKRYRKVKVRESKGGSPCPDLEDYRPCAKNSCKSDCILSDWGQWGSCSKTCGGGSRTRSRVIISPPNEGRECDILKDFEPCNEFQCIATRDCEVGQWSAWSPCTATCGGGIKRREREIQVPATGGGRCDFDLSQKMGCNGFRCPGEPCIDRPEAQEVVPCSILKAMFGCEKRLIDVAKSNGVPYPEDKPTEARVMDGCPSTCGMCTECAPGCQLRDIGNLNCDIACNNAECRFDDGDCEENNISKVSCVLPKPPNGINFILNEQILSYKNQIQGNNTNIDDNIEREYKKGDIIYVKCEEGKRFRKYSAIPYFKYQCNEGGFIQQLEPKGTPLLFVDGDGIPRIPSCEEDECPYVMIQEAPQLIGSVNTLYKRDTKHSYTYIMYRDIGEPIFITGDHQRIILGPVGTLYLISIDAFYPEYSDPSIEKYNLWSLVDIGEQKILQEFVELKPICLKDPNTINQYNGTKNFSQNSSLSPIKNDEIFNFNRPLRFLSQVTPFNNNYEKISKRVLIEKPSTFIMGKMRYCEDQPEVKEQGISCETLSKMCDVNIPNPQNYGLPENSYVWQICPGTCNKCEECSEGCPEWFRGNTVCDKACNNKNCNYDDGDCVGFPESDNNEEKKDLNYQSEMNLNKPVEIVTSTTTRNTNVSINNNIIIPQGSITYFAGKFRNCTDIPELIDSLASCKALKQTCQLKLPLSSSSLEAGLSHSSTISQVCPKTCGICEECSPGCPKWFINNGYCDINCQNPDCDFDGEDCIDNNKVFNSNKSVKINEMNSSNNEKICLDNPIISEIFDEDCEQLKNIFGCSISLDKIRQGLKLPEGIKPSTKLKDLCRLTCKNCNNKKYVNPNTSKKTNLDKRPFTFIMNEKRYCEDQPEVSKKGITCKSLSSMCNATIPGAKSYGLPESTQIWRICPGTCNKCRECSLGCPEWFKGNTVCDQACNNKACNYDDGDCENHKNINSFDMENNGDLNYEVKYDGKTENSDRSGIKNENNSDLDLDKKYFEMLKENGEECKDDPKVEQLSGFTCEQITSVFDCSTLLKELPGSSIPEDIPKDTLLRHACAESCGLCNHFIKDKNSLNEHTSHLCKDDVFVSFVTGKCRDIMNFSVNLNEVCNESLSERTTLRDLRKSSFNMNKKVYDHCPKSCGRCRSECDDDPRLQPGECRVAIETANIQGYGCDIPLLQVSVSLADRFDEEKEYLLLSDVCSRSCNYCTPNGLLSNKNVNSFCSIKSTKHWGPGYQLEIRSNSSGGSGITADRLIVSCSPGYSSPDLNESVDAICDIKSSIYTLPETFRCQEPHVEVMQVVLQIKEAADFDFTSVSSIYTALYSSLPIYQPNGLKIEAISTREFDTLVKDKEQIKCEDQNNQLKSFGINCSMLKSFCSKTLEELAKQFNRNIPEGVNANIKVSLACPISCDNCQEFIDTINSIKRDEQNDDDTETDTNKESKIGALYVLFDVGFFLSSSKGREATFESSLKDPKISQRFITSLKTQFASRGVRLAPKEFEQGKWDSQQAIVSNTRLASEDIQKRTMRSKFRSARMIKILKSDWDRFYSGQKGVGMDEEARNLFYTSGISMPLIRSSYFGPKESVFLKRPLLNLQNSYLKCNNINNNTKGFTNNLTQLSSSIKNKSTQYRDNNNNCCNLPQEFRSILVNEGCGSLIYDREPDGVQMDLFCRGTSKAKNSCYQRFQEVILKYKNKDGIICNTLKYAQQLIDSWCFVSPKFEFEKPRSNNKYCFSSIKDTIDVGMDSQEFVSATFKIFQSRCEQNGCFRSHLKYFDAVTQLHTAWGYPLPNSPLKKYKSPEFNNNRSHISQGGSANYQPNTEVLLEETNENWLDLLCTTTKNGVHCQESLSILLERNPIKSKTLLLNPCHSKCFMIVAGKLGSSLQKFGKIAQDPQSESLGLLLRHYSRHFCVKNHKGQVCGPLLFAGASFALEASLIHKQAPSNSNFKTNDIVNQNHIDDSNSLSGFQTQKTSSYCSSGCFSHYIGDGMCDLQCFNEACDWDKGDCHSASMYPEIYIPLEDLFKGCVINAVSNSKHLSSTYSNFSGKMSNNCSSTCRARYSILTETLGCCTSVAVDLYQSLTQIDERIPTVFSKASSNTLWSISRLEQICGMSLDRTCSNGMPRIQRRILLGVNHPDSDIIEDPQTPVIITKIISRSIKLLESDITKVFITREPTTYIKKENKFLIDVLIDTGSSEILDFEELLDYHTSKRRLEEIWSSDFCLELGDSKGEECSVDIIEVTKEPLVTLGITNSTAPTLPWMNSIGFSFLNKDLPPEPCTLSHNYIQDTDRYKVTSSIKQTNNKSFPHGSRLSISCSNNQHVASSGKSPDILNCNNGRWETSSNLKCNKKCKKLSILPDGLKINDPHNFNGNLFINHGSKLEVECFSEEYRSTSHLIKDYVECIDGEWSIPKLDCKKSCTNLEPGSLGISHIVVGTEFRHNDQRKVYCSDDHYLSPKSGNPNVNFTISNIISTKRGSNDTSGLEDLIRKDYFILTCNNGTWESEPLICVKGTLSDFSRIKRGIEVTMTHIFSLKTLIACVVIVATILVIILGIWWAWVLRYKQLTDMYDLDHYERIQNARRILLQLSGIEYSNTIDQTTENSQDFNQENENHYSSWESLNNIPQNTNELCIDGDLTNKKT